MQKLKDYFAVLDTDADGRIKKNDAILIIRGSGIPGLDDDFDTVIRGMSANETALCFEDVLNIAISLKRTQTSGGARRGVMARRLRESRAGV